MAQKFLTNIDLNQNQIIKGQFESVAADPTTGNFEGRLIYNSTEKVIKVYTGTAWRKALHAVSSNTTALTSSESNGTVTLTIADAVAGTTSGLLSGADKQKLDNAATAATPNTLALRDASGRLQVAAPSSDNDAANKGYVDAARSGLDVKESVRAATTGDITLSGTQTIDDVVLVEGDRVLVKNQDTASENGIYVVDEDAWARSTDADTNTEVNAGMFTFVEEGTVNADSGWVLTTNNPITLGTTSLAFAQFSGAGQVIAGDGLTKTGNQLDVGGTTDRITVTADAVDIANTYVGQTSITTLGTVGTGTWQGSTVAIEYGGTGATSASVARTNLADTPTAGQTTGTATLARVASQTVGDNSATSFTVTHNFGTRDVVVQVYDLSTYETVVTDVVRTNTNSVTITFSVAPDTGAYKVVVTG
jgi:phage-related tail fiber protein